VNPGFFEENVGMLVSGSLSVGIPTGAAAGSVSGSGGTNPGGPKIESRISG